MNVNQSSDCMNVVASKLISVHLEDPGLYVIIILTFVLMKQD